MDLNKPQEFGPSVTNKSKQDFYTYYLHMNKELHQHEEKEINSDQLEDFPPNFFLELMVLCTNVVMVKVSVY